MNTTAMHLEASNRQSAAGDRPVNLMGLNRSGLQAFFHALGERPFRAEQVMKWVHQHGVIEFEAMTNLSKDLRHRLRACAEIRAPGISDPQVSADGTRKWLLQVDPVNSIETVFIPEPDRGTLCVSSQAGCALNCTFCSTARQGFGRNLRAEEIVGQLWQASAGLSSFARSGRRITNIVLMGMGEPLLNFDAVVQALDVMLDDCAYGLARKRVTLSTAGVLPGLEKLMTRCPVSLAVSLHAPDNALRDELVPLNRSYPIEDLLDVCARYAGHGPKESVTFEYVMLAGVNDSPAQARDLARLLSRLPAKVNLIPFNPFRDSGYRCSSPGDIDRFREILTRAGLVTITRKTRGGDIDAACGQLAGRIVPRSRRVALRKGLPAGDPPGHAQTGPTYPLPGQNS